MSLKGTLFLALGNTHFDNIVNISIDALGNKAPRVLKKDKHAWLDELKGKDLTLACEAQGHPVPTFR